LLEFHFLTLLSLSKSFLSDFDESYLIFFDHLLFLFHSGVIQSIFLLNDHKSTFSSPLDICFILYEEDFITSDGLISSSSYLYMIDSSIKQPILIEIANE
jgi:hypothetical protein